MASMIRSLVNAAIDETENDYSMSISDIIEMHHSDYYKDTDSISMKTDEDEDPPLLIF